MLMDGDDEGETTVQDTLRYTADSNSIKSDLLPSVEGGAGASALSQPLMDDGPVERVDV